MDFTKEPFDLEAIRRSNQAEPKGKITEGEMMGDKTLASINKHVSESMDAMWDMGLREGKRQIIEIVVAASMNNPNITTAEIIRILTDNYKTE
jgi:hypothetical protein